jgi:hypothetical protein
LLQWLCRPFRTQSRIIITNFRKPSTLHTRLIKFSGTVNSLWREWLASQGLSKTACSLPGKPFFYWAIRNFKALNVSDMLVHYRVAFLESAFPEFGFTSTASA